MGLGTTEIVVIIVVIVVIFFVWKSNKGGK